MDEKLEELTFEEPSLEFDEGIKPDAEEPAAVAMDFGTGLEVPGQEAAPASEAAQIQDPADTLTEQEMAVVDDFVTKIDIANSNAVMNYGSGAQKKMADFSEKSLSTVQTKDMGEIGGMITQLVTELKNFDVDEDDGKILGFFKKRKNDLEAMKAKYSKVETNVNNIQEKLEQTQVQLMKDSAMLDKMYEYNLKYYKELTMYIVAGKKKLQQVRSRDLAELQQKANQSGSPMDAQAAKDLSDLCDRFEKKLHDLELTRTISMQTGPQIRTVQASDNVMAEKIQSTIVNMIPLWKNQMVIALGVQHSAEAAKTQRMVTDMTNELLTKNADALKMASVETAKEAERGIVDMETLKHTNETLISTLDEIMTIQKESKEKRAAAQTELVEIENQLRAKMLEAATRQN